MRERRKGGRQTGVRENRRGGTGGAAMPGSGAARRVWVSSTMGFLRRNGMERPVPSSARDCVGVTKVLLFHRVRYHHAETAREA